jgi:hypothetical protein
VWYAYPPVRINQKNGIFPFDAQLIDSLGYIPYGVPEGRFYLVMFDEGLL